MSVSGGDVTGVTISSVMSSTNYAIEVAVENNVGVGNYTDPVIVETIRSKLLGYSRCTYM